MQQLNLEDLSIVLTTAVDELDVSPTGIDSERNSEINFEFLEANENYLKKIALLEALLLTEKKEDRSKWVYQEDEGESDDVIKSHEHSSEIVEEVKSGPWYQLTMQEVFNDSVNNFKRARELYQCVCASYSKNGYLYKLTEKISYSLKYTIISKKILNDIKSNSERAQEVLEKYLLGNELIGQTIAKKLRDINFVGIYNQIIILPERYFEQNTKILAKLFEGVLYLVENLSKLIYFREVNKKYIEMQNDCSIYEPGNFHNWGVNLSWLLAHLKKGITFTVISDIPTNKNRKTKDAKNEHSAFLREICTCLPADYVLIFNGEETTLKPSLRWDPRNCKTNGLPGNGVNPSPEAIETFFKHLVEGYESKKPFSYSWFMGLRIKKEKSSEFLPGFPKGFLIKKKLMKK